VDRVSTRLLCRLALAAAAVAAGILSAGTCAAQSVQQNALNLDMSFNGPSVQFPYMDTFYAASNAYYQSIGMTMPGPKGCQAYLSWDIAEQAVGSGASGTEGTRSWFENWLANAVGHCDQPLLTFKYQSGVTTKDVGAYPSASDFQAAMAAFLNTDWSYTGWTGSPLTTFAYQAWNEPNNGAASGAGLTTAVPARLAADYYLALRQLCTPANGCTVAAENFGSNGNLNTTFPSNCPDGATTVCSNATYMDQYKIYLTTDAPNYGFTTSFRPETVSYHGWDDVNNYINGNAVGCLSVTNPACTAYVFVASNSGTWGNSVLWDSEVAAGQSGSSSPGPYMQGCAAAHLFKLTGLASSRFQRVYYTQPYVSNGQYFSLFTSTGAEKPAFTVVADRSISYEPADGSICYGDQKTTSLQLSANPSAASSGDAVTLTATLSPYAGTANVYNSANLKSGQTAANPATDKETPVGTDGETVTFSAGGNVLGTATLSSGVATLTLSSLSAGSYGVSASYAGDTYFTSATSPSTPLTVTGTVQLVITSTLSALSGGYQEVVTVTNSGTAPAQNVVLSTATLGSATGSPLPVQLGTIAAGGSASTTLTFPSAAGADNTATAERFSGTYTGGSFGGTRRATLP
jgi:hypothetical protein